MNGNHNDDDEASLGNHDVPEIIPLDSYNIEEGVLHLQPAVLNSLTSGSLYCQAAAKIFQDQAFLQQSHGAVIQALQRASIEVVDTHDNARVTETMLTIDNPWKPTGHLSIIDGLMTAHMRQVINIRKAVDAVKQYTSVDKREEPMDPVDALLFWINKICLLVRDDMEKVPMAGRHSNDVASAPVVPEMEDLYEDMCDGACVCALIAFYKPQQLKMESICFNDPMGIGDCAYNLSLLKQFCERHLPWNPFHFATEDILYLHENLQPNVNAFLADLFQFFEGDNGRAATVSSPPAVPGSRRFAPIQAIPDLRQQNRQNRSQHPPRVKHTLPATTGMSSVSPSLMNSADSLMTNRSTDSLRYQTYSKKTAPTGGFVKSPTTNFGELMQRSPDKNLMAQSYLRSDSMPARAGIRLALEEKRREHERRKLLESSLHEVERQQKGKEAFFTLMGKNVPSAVDKLNLPGDQNGSPMRRLRATSDAGNGAAVDSPSSRQIEALNKTVQTLQEKVERMSAQQQHLARQMDDKPTSMMSHAVSQPVVFSSAVLPPHHQSQRIYAQPFAVAQPTVPLSVSPPSASGFFVSHGEPQPPVDLSMSPSQSSYAVGSNTFRLHDEQAAASRLDPQLELNRNLTSWGMAYKPGQPARSTRRTWENQTFVKSELDLVNRPDIVPQVVSHHDVVYQDGMNVDDRQSMYDQQAHMYMQPSALSAARSSRTSSQGSRPPSYPSVQEPAFYAVSPNHQGQHAQSGFARMGSDSWAHQADSSSSGGGSIGSPKPLSMSQSQTQPSPSSSATLQPPGKAKSEEPQPVRDRSPAGFVVEGVATDSNASRRTREMEAKREALMAKTLRRKEQIDQKVEEIEAKNAEKRMEEQKKMEMIENRKFEKEMRRQKVLEEYQRRKAEQEALDRNMATPTSGSANTTPRTNRGHSQPPVVRPKSQLVPGQQRAVPPRNRPQSSAVDTPGSVDENMDSVGRHVMTVSSIAEPTLKLFSKPSPKSNRNIIINALQYSVFAGA
uniref:Calponin-homology (CH) domain-containing protein n=1 Tax=Plectus sambesii TaxID=2011161 RepID=A0A914WH24_9BILA